MSGATSGEHESGKSSVFRLQSGTNRGRTDTTWRDHFRHLVRRTAGSLASLVALVAVLACARLVVRALPVRP